MGNYNGSASSKIPFTGKQKLSTYFFSYVHLCENSVLKIKVCEFQEGYHVPELCRCGDILQPFHEILSSLLCK